MAQSTVQRLMLADDANPAGNVHGGTILKEIENAGYIAAMRHCNPAGTTEPTHLVLAQVELMDFRAPMHIGEVAKLDAHVTFTSERSIEVLVDVSSEDLLRGAWRSTNQARLWYVAVTASEASYASAKVPQLVLPEAEAAAGRQRYEAQRTRRSVEQAAALDGPVPTEGVPVSSCRGVLTQVVLPSDCVISGSVQVCRGGVVLKAIDNAAGVAAVRLCRSNVVTASIGDVHLLEPCKNGEVVEVVAVPTFSSKRSVEIRVDVTAENVITAHKRQVCSALLMFVSLDSAGRVGDVPAIFPESDEEIALYRQGQARYQARRGARAK